MLYGGPASKGFLYEPQRFAIETEGPLYYIYLGGGEYHPPDVLCHSATTATRGAMVDLQYQIYPAICPTTTAMLTLNLRRLLPLNVPGRSLIRHINVRPSHKQFGNQRYLGAISVTVSYCTVKTLCKGKPRD
jgi:hypothetical protein